MMTLRRDDIERAIAGDNREEKILLPHEIPSG